jgi:hypothetical protein
VRNRFFGVYVTLQIEAHFDCLFQQLKKAPSPSISQASKPKVFTSKRIFTFIQSPIARYLVLPCLVVSQLALKFEVGREQSYRFIDGGSIIFRRYF